LIVINRQPSSPRQVRPFYKTGTSAILFPLANLSNRLEFSADHHGLVGQKSTRCTQKLCSEESSAMRHHPKSLSNVLNAATYAAILATGSIFTGCGSDSGRTTIAQGVSSSAVDSPGPNTPSPSHQATADTNTPGSVETPAAQQIKIDNFSFSPQTLTVPVGATITWINQDDVPHTVVDSGKRFKSAALDTDDKFSFTFTTIGEYPYFCGIHTHMTGKVVVK
jgi:plastocyanin